jgi:hypothetical protein
MSDDLPPHPNVLIKLYLWFTCLMKLMFMMINTYIKYWLVTLEILSIGCKPMILITLTWLKLDQKCLKLVVVGLWIIYHLEPCMSRSWPLGHIGSVLLSVVTQAFLCNILCVRFSSLFRRCRWRLAVGSLGFDSAGFRTRARHWCRIAKECFHL